MKMHCGSILPVAQGCGAPGGQPGQQESIMTMLGPLVIMIALFYVMVIVPQKRKEKERKKAIEETKTGERVIFSGGIIGTISNVKENTFIVKIADKTKVEILKGSVLRVLGKDEDAKEEDR